MPPFLSRRAESMIVHCVIEVKHIGRNPRFDREGHWAETGNIGQTYGTLGRY